MPTPSTRRADLDYHVARVLLLLRGFDARAKPFDGLTKLAKADFLLRYPRLLDEILTADGVSWPPGLEPTRAEKLAVESAMIRYKYGPWDELYYPIIGSMIARGLIETVPGRGRLTMRLTDKGEAAAQRLAADWQWSTVAKRAELIASKYDVTGNKLKQRIYAQFPSLMEQGLGSEIR